MLDLINETDIQLFMHFCTGNPGGEEIVEFLIDIYDEMLAASWETPYLLARKDFDGLIEVYEGRFEKWGDATTAAHNSSAASKIVRSKEFVRRKVALEYAERGYELDQDDPFVVSTYVSARWESKGKATRRASLKTI